MTQEYSKLSAKELEINLQIGNLILFIFFFLLCERCCSNTAKSAIILIINAAFWGLLDLSLIMLLKILYKLGFSDVLDYLLEGH